MGDRGRSPIHGVADHFRLPGVDTIDAGEKTPFLAKKSIYFTHMVAFYHIFVHID